MSMLGEITHLQTLTDDLKALTMDPHKLPASSEQVGPSEQMKPVLIQEADGCSHAAEVLLTEVRFPEVSSFRLLFPSLSAGHRRPEGLRVHLVLPNSALVAEHLQEVEHVQVGFHVHRYYLSSWQTSPNTLTRLICYPACTLLPPCGPKGELQRCAFRC